MKKLLSILFLGIIFFQTYGSVPTKKECTASLTALIDKNDYAKIQLKLQECMQHGSIDDQFKSVKDQLKDKPEAIEKVGRVQFEINEKNRTEAAQLESESSISWWMRAYMGVLAVAAFIGLSNKALELKEEWDDIERDERLRKLKEQQKDKPVQN